MEIIDVVMKLTGPVDPIGETNTDAKRLENLKQLTSLTEELVCKIDKIAYEYQNNHQASMRLAAIHCSKFLASLGIEK